MAMNPETPEEPVTPEDDVVLPCGRSLDRLWQRLDGGADPVADEHERDCPHCRTARAGLEALVGATQVVRQERDDPPPSPLRGRIMSAVRAEVRRGDLLPLPGGELGPAWVSEQAVAVVLRFAADSVPGVRARSCRLRYEAGRVDVELSIVVPAGPRTVPELVGQVRERVVTAAATSIGVRIGRVDVTVADIRIELDAPGGDR